MFVVHAIIVTFLTTPLVLFFYPEKYRQHVHGDSNQALEGVEGSAGDDSVKTKFALILDKMEALPSAMTLSQLLRTHVYVPPRYVDDVNSSIDEKMAIETVDNDRLTRPIIVEALRLMELTTRTSAVIKSQESDSLLYNDPLVAAYRTFGQLNQLTVNSKISVVNSAEFAQAVSDHISSTRSQMVFIPWARGVTSVSDEDKTGTRNPFDGIFHKTTTQDQTSSVVYSEFIRNVFSKSPSDVALFVDRGMVRSFGGSNKQHLFLPFIGGPDDRLALNFLVQLCGNSLVTATVIKIKKTESGASSSEHHIEEPAIEHTLNVSTNTSRCATSG